MKVYCENDKIEWDLDLDVPACQNPFHEIVALPEPTPSTEALQPA